MKPLRLLLCVSCAVLGLTLGGTLLGGDSNADSKEDEHDIPLGPVGGRGKITTHKHSIRVTEVLANGPGVQSGLQVSDVIEGAFGDDFGETQQFGYTGAVQDLGVAIERAETGDGKLPLQITRPGKGLIKLMVHLQHLGPYGAAYPLGSMKFAVMYDSACMKIKERVLAHADQGYNEGWYGLCLLGHPHCNDVYAPAIVALRDVIAKRFIEPVADGGYAYAPVEDLLLDGHAKNPNFPANSGGPGNWQLGADTMFLAEYRQKTGDKTVDVALQRAAEMSANRIQWWKQPPQAANGYSPGFKDIAGIVAHTGVVGDYIHLGWGGGINITGVHIFGALALAKQAGVKMSVMPRDGHYFGYPEPPVGAVPAGMEHKDFSLSEKFAMQWAWLERCSGDQGAVGYTTGQGGSPGDASARTAATLFAILASGKQLDEQERKRVIRMEGYLTDNYATLMESHAYSHGGQCFYQLALPFLDDRNQRFIMDNWRFFYTLSRQPDGSIAYFGCRGNNGGDGYLGLDAVMDSIWGLTGSIALGGLPYTQAITGRSPDRIFVGFTSPTVTWPMIAARHCTIHGNSQSFLVDVRDAKGVPLAPKKYSAMWSCTKNPGLSATLSHADGASVTVSFPSPGHYSMTLTVTYRSYRLVEPIEMDVDAAVAVLAGTRGGPVIRTQPQNAHVVLGGTATMTIGVTPTAGSVYEWRLNGRSLWPNRHGATLTLANVGGGLAGTYDCVVTGPGGAVTSAPATVSISDAGRVVRGGLWCETYGSKMTVGNIEALAQDPRFPRLSEASSVLTGACEIPAAGDGTIMRVTGWIEPDKTGPYRLYLTGPGQSALFLGADEDHVGAQAAIAQMTPSAPRDWSHGSSSHVVTLQAGQRYALEIRHCRSRGDQGVIAWTWQRPGEEPPADGSAPLPLSFCSYQTGGTYDLLQDQEPPVQAGGTP